MKKTAIIFIILLLLSVNVQAQNDTIRVATYSLLNFPGNNIEERIDYFRTVLTALDPDLILCQDIRDSAGVEYFLNEILDPELYAHGEYIHCDGQSDNMIYFKSDLFEALGVITIQTDLRDISLFPMQYLPAEEAPMLYVASAYLKGSDAVADREQRLGEVTQLITYLNDEGLNEEHILFGGILNFYTSEELGYQALMQEGLFYDPAETPGEWHDSEELTMVHTQSTRTERFGNGASGGLDDRFDFILASEALAVEDGWAYVPETYAAFGNDGQHLNLSINEGENQAVSAEIAEALYYASDHLPVIMELCVYIPEDTTSVSPQPQLPRTCGLLRAYPNPFNNTMRVGFVLPRVQNVSLNLMDCQGRLIRNLIEQSALGAGTHQYQLNAGELVTGLYFLQLEAGSASQTIPVTLLK